MQKLAVGSQGSGGLISCVGAGSFGEHSASNAQEKQNLAEAITISQTPQHGHSAGFEVCFIVL